MAVVNMEYTFEHRESSPEEGLQMINFSCLNSRKDIPFQKDWPNRSWTITRNYPCFFERNMNAKILEDDIWILGQLRCGTTWMQEIVWLITHNFDFEAASRIPSFVKTVNFE